MVAMWKKVREKKFKMAAPDCLMLAAGAAIDRISGFGMLLSKVFRTWEIL